MRHGRRGKDRENGIRGYQNKRERRRGYGEETREDGREGRERGGERGDEREVKEVANIYKLNFSSFRLKILFPL
jgi:hypothetical protein